MPFPLSLSLSLGVSSSLPGTTTLRPRRDLLSSLNRHPSLSRTPFMLSGQPRTHIDELILSSLIPFGYSFFQSKVYYHECYSFYDTVTILLSTLHILHLHPFHHLSHLTLPLWPCFSHAHVLPPPAFGPFNLVFLIITYYRCPSSDSH